MRRGVPVTRAILCVTCEAILDPADPQTSRLFIPIHQEGRPDRYRCAACTRERGPLTYTDLPHKPPFTLAIVTAIKRVLAWLRVVA